MTVVLVFVVAFIGWFLLASAALAVLTWLSGRDDPLEKLWVLPAQDPDEHRTVR